MARAKQNISGWWIALALVLALLFALFVTGGITVERIENGAAQNK